MKTPHNVPSFLFKNMCLFCLIDLFNQHVPLTKEFMKAGSSPPVVSLWFSMFLLVCLCLFSSALFRYRLLPLVTLCVCVWKTIMFCLVRCILTLCWLLGLLRDNVQSLLEKIICDMENYGKIERIYQSKDHLLQLTKPHSALVKTQNITLFVFFL